MAKALGLLLIVVSGALLGFYAASGLSRRSSALERIQRLIAHIGSQIRYTAAPTGEILKTAAASAEFRSLEFLKAAAGRLDADGDCHAAWQYGVSHYGKVTGLTLADVELLQHFGEGLGRTDVEGQLENCRICAEQLTQRLESARREAAAKHRLYLTLGVTGGMAMALLLL